MSVMHFISPERHLKVTADPSTHFNVPFVALPLSPIQCLPNHDVVNSC